MSADDDSLVRAGRAGPEQPKRFYKFALIDPIDQPFATFRYYYRTWDQLRKLGLLKQDRDDPSEQDDLPVIEPQDDAHMIDEIGNRRHSSRKLEDGIQHCDEAKSITGVGTDGTDTQHLTRHSSIRLVTHVEEIYQVPGTVPRQASNASNRVRTPPRFNRLSVPPSIKLNPLESTQRQLSTVPHKSGSSSSTAYQPHPAYPAETGIMPPSGPVKLVRDEDTSTLPLIHQGRSETSLLGIIASTWKRRGTAPTDNRADSHRVS